MKMTIVLDTTDPDGLEDAYKIARMLRQKHVKHAAFGSGKVSFSKIALIKFIRLYGQRCEKHLADCRISEMTEEPRLSGLKDCALFVDAHWQNLKGEG
jgi:hypothetical protein